MIPKKHLLYLVFLLGLSKASAQERNNIIVFLVDDMGWQDTSYPFHNTKTAFNNMYHTPNMERLAAMGVAFTDAYATPVCTPSRVSLITGVNATKHRITNWTSPFKNQPTGRKDSVLQDPTWNHNGLSPVAGVENTFEATSVAQILKDNGYFTIHVGKAHWGSAGTPASNPLNLGFVVNISGTSTGRPQSYLGKDKYGRLSNDYHGVENMQEYFDTETYLTEAVTREALKTLEYPVAQKLPFFLHIGHYALHDPLMADNRYYQKYLDKGLSKADAVYASMVEGMDKSLGDILDYLEKNNLLENTSILFLSDNGGLSYSHARGGQMHTHNKPLRSGKGSIYEGGIRVPLILKGTDTSLKNIRAGEPVIIEDVFPTILDLAKIENAVVKQHVDGKSLLPYIKGTATLAPPRSLLFHIPNKWTDTDVDGFNYRSAMRKGNMKIIYNMRDQSYELYDLSIDIEETNNLINSKKHKKIKTEMIKSLGDLLRENQAGMPVDVKSKAAIPYPTT